MKIEDILNMSASELSGLSTRELQKVTNSLVDASNKRLKRLEAKGLNKSSTAYQKRATKATRSKGGGLTAKFSSNVRKIKSDVGKRNRLKEIIATTKNFLQDQTSTIPGAMAQARNIMDKTGVSMDDFFFYKNGKPKKGRLRNFWKAYNQFKQEHMNANPDQWSRGSPVEMVEEFFENVYSKHADKKGRLGITTIKEEVIRQYEQQEGNESGISTERDGLLERVDSPRGASTKKTSGGVTQVERFGPLNIKQSFESVNPLSSAFAPKTRKSKK